MSERAEIYAMVAEQLIPLGVGVVVDVIRHIQEPSKVAEEYLKESDRIAQSIKDTANAELEKNNG